MLIFSIIVHFLTQKTKKHGLNHAFLYLYYLTTIPNNLESSTA